MRRIAMVALGLTLAVLAVPDRGADGASAQAPGGPVDLSWYATGDSYSSGEGINPTTGACAQSDDAWGPLAAGELDTEDGFDVDLRAFTACTGLLVRNHYNRVGGAKSLWEWADEQGVGTGERFDVITMTFGGNDVSFAEIINDCLGGFWGTFTDELNDVGFDGCDIDESTLNAEVDRLDNADRFHIDDDSAQDEFNDGSIRGSLAAFYETVARRHLSARGRLVVLGYPRLFAPSAEWGLLQGRRCHGVTRGDANMLGRVAERLDDLMKKEVESANLLLQASTGRPASDEAIHFISAVDLWGGPENDRGTQGHELCGPGEDWLNGPGPHLNSHRSSSGAPLGGRSEHSFHPHQLGHTAQAEAVVAYVEGQDWTSRGAVDPLPEGFTAVQVVADTSGSMEEAVDSSGRTKMEAAQLALGGILTALSSESGASGGGTPTQAGLVSFESFSEVVVPMTDDVNQLRNGVSGLIPGSGTNLGAGLEEGLDQVEAAGQGGTLILLSDGLSNEGLTTDEILAQLVPRANALGVKIFTIGFGESGSLDEDLLRQLASQTGGSYGQAETIVSIQGLFLAARHQSQGTVQMQVASAVGLGETAPADTFVVPEGAAELHTALAWPGSDLDMTLIDPSGNPVGADYEGARFVTDQVTEVAVIEAPEPGEWRMDVTGVDMTGPTEEYFAIASTRGQLALVDPAGPVIWPFVLVGAGLLAGGGAGAVLLATRGRRGRGTTTTVPTLSVSVTAGHSTGLTLQIRPGDVLGRGTDADVTLPDDSVSRRHCQFILVDGSFAVLDLDSSSGTFRNGEAIQQARLSVGDMLDLGEAQLLVTGGTSV